ncbi:MAG: hypothetical protein M1455_00660 [Actinobacteria bacterium]|nr:hypothetical protein [Actinomycetota bacterium]
MRKKIAATIFAVALGLAVLLLMGGCGGDDSSSQQPHSGLAGINTGDTLDRRLEQLKQMEMTVEVVNDGQSSGKWTQKAGSWRWDDPTDKTSYMIYNSQKKKTWVVSGNSATETAGDSESLVSGYNPAMIMGIYSMMPRTGGSDNTWEFSVPGAGKLTMEMNGPEGLPTKMTSEDAQTGKTTVTEFKYSNVGNVPDSTFELPANIEIIPAGGTGTNSNGYGGGGVSVPGMSTNIAPGGASPSQ